MTARPLRLLFYNAFLLRVGLPWPGGGRILHTKPGVAARAVEIGQALAGRYHVVAMAEVFDEVERRSLLAGWGPAAVAHATGPAPPRLLPGKGSGLFTVVDGPKLVRRETHPFRQRGALWRDSDAYAAKGVLMVEVDVGACANLEVFSTHLIYGNDFLKRPGTPFGAAADVRQEQADELLAFVDRVHRPENVALVVGDFNVPADDPQEALPDRHYRRLRDGFAAAGFDDVWAVHGEGSGYTAVDDAVTLATISHPEEGPSGFCLEPARPASPEVHAVRIDYAWLQRPNAQQGVAVTVSTIRRRSFPRAPGTDDCDRLPFMSDHMALHLELLLESAETAPARDP